MDTFEAISSRRAIKKFDPNHKMTSEEVDSLMKLTILSPTSYNQQNWRFVTVTDQSIKEKIGIAARNQAQPVDGSLVILLCGNMSAWKDDPLRYWQNHPTEKQELVKTKDSINQNILVQNFRVVDARSKERFEGKVPEPREGLKSGNIKNSVCIPFGSCLNQDRTFRNKQELEKIFQSSLKNLNDKNIVFSCGSGVTACVLALAYSLINDKYRPCIYDGSWAEYGLI